MNKERYLVWKTQSFLSTMINPQTVTETDLRKTTDPGFYILKFPYAYTRLPEDLASWTTDSTNRSASLIVLPSASPTRIMQILVTYSSTTAVPSPQIYILTQNVNTPYSASNWKKVTMTDNSHT